MELFFGLICVYSLFYLMIFAVLAKKIRTATRDAKAKFIRFSLRSMFLLTTFLAIAFAFLRTVDADQLAFACLLFAVMLLIGFFLAMPVILSVGVVVFLVRDVGDTYRSLGGSRSRRSRLPRSLTLPHEFNG